METGTYNDMALRPYESNIQDRDVDAFRELTGGGLTVAPSLLSGVASNFIKPSASAQTSVAIDNGWDVARFRFIMTVEIVDNIGGGPTRKIIQGYTNHLGATTNGSIDPNMILYFNNMITVRTSVIETPHGRSNNMIVAESDQILRGDYEMSLTQQPSITHSMRPQDIFTTMGRQALGVDDDILDPRTAFSEDPLKRSRRTNCSASHYLSDIINGYTSVYSGNEYSSDYGVMMKQAKGNVVENTISSDKFFFFLKEKTSNFLSNGYVTYQELASTLNGFDQNTLFVKSKDVVKKSTATPMENHIVGQTEHWNGSNAETVWSSILSQSLPSIMMDLMLTKVCFMATNRTLDGSYQVQMMDVGSFAEGIDLSKYIDVFISRLKAEVLRGLSRNNGIDFNLNMYVDVVGETRISISIAGGPTTDYATPSFCDGLFSPVLSNSQHNLVAISHDLEALSNNINTHPPRTGQSVGGCINSASSGYEI